MDSWDSLLTHSFALFGVIGFAILLIVGVVARITWTRAVKANRISEQSEIVLGAVGGPSTYRSVRSKTR